MLRFRFIILRSNWYSRICIILFLFTRFDSSSSDEDVPLAAVARGVGKSNGDKTDDGDEGDDKDDEDVPSIGTKSDENFGLVSVSSIVGVHVVQNHNPQCDNLSSNFVGLTSHLTLNYDPPLGPFCEYVGTFVQSPMYESLYTNSYIFTSILYKRISIICWFSMNRYVLICILSATTSFKAIYIFCMISDTNSLV